MTGELRIGLVGFGQLGRLHAWAWRSIPLLYSPLPLRPRLACVCDVDPARARLGADEAEVPRAETDWRAVVADAKVDAVDVCTPNSEHHPVVRAALEAGKHVYCEKPLAYDLGQARELAALAGRAGVTHQVVSEYRYFPAMMRARELVAEGGVGRLFHLRGAYLHSGYVSRERPMEWRLRREIIGGGALMDLGPHLLDLALLLAGPVEAVSAAAETFTRERPVRGGGTARVAVEDALVMLLRFRDGALGTAELTRVATGSEDEMRLELHGDRGALRFEHMDPNWLYHFDERAPASRRGYTRIATVQKYRPPAVAPPPKCALGYARSHVASQFAFLQAVADGRPGEPDFDAGVAVHAVIDAAYRSVEAGGWVRVGDAG